LTEASINERVKVVRSLNKKLADAIAEAVSDYQADVIATEPNTTVETVKKE
jgi:hypothetical protein